MSKKEWAELCDSVTNRMVAHVRPHVSPLFRSRTKPRLLEGSGSFVEASDSKAVITCEHVSRGRDLDFVLLGLAQTYGLGLSVNCEPEPVDVEIVSLKPGNWSADCHKSCTIPKRRFALRHDPSCMEEMMFIHGFAKENSGVGFGALLPASTGYLTQVIAECSSEDDMFELFWDPGKETYSSATSPDLRESHKFIDPSGISGTLVWDTKFMAMRNSGIEWKPDHACVTGMVQRWDEATKSLICLRVEKFRHMLH